MDKEEAKRIITYDKEDEHTQLLIERNIRLCQTTMLPEINKAETSAQRAHCRIDDILAAGGPIRKMEDRVMALDGDKTGQVTILWRDREKISNLIWLVTIAVIVNIVVLFMRSPSAIADKNAIKEAVKSALTEIKSEVK